MVSAILEALAAFATSATILTSPYVVDGDTLRQGGQSYRIWGIDAPEADTAAGAAATEAMSGLVSGARLTCHDTGERSYGRIVARCELPSGADLACRMVAMGHAEDWPEYSGGRYEDC